MKPRRRAFVILLLFAAMVPSKILAQEGGAIPPLQPSDTTSPRATLSSFLQACNELYSLAKTQGQSSEFPVAILPAAERIRDCLDLSALPMELRDSVGLESAVYLKEILDRIELPKTEEIPGPAGADSDPVPKWRIPGTRLTIARVTEGPQAGAYLFSPATVQQASKFYSAAKLLPYREGGSTITANFRDLYLTLTKNQPILAIDTSSPRGMLILFLDSFDKLYEIIQLERYFERSDPKYRPHAEPIYSCLDMSEIPEYSREFYTGEAAVCIKEILDRVELPAPELIPGPENIQTKEGVEPLTRWQIPNTQLTIAKVLEGPRQGEFLFSAESVKNAVELYHKVNKQPYRTGGRPVAKGAYEWFLTSPGNSTVAALIDRLPNGVRWQVLGLAVWQWIGLLLAIFTGFFAMVIVYRFGRSQSLKNRDKSLLRYWLSALFVVSAMFVPLVFNYFVFEYLSLRGTALYITNFIGDLVFLLALIVVILAISSRLADSIIAYQRNRELGIDASLIHILCRILSLIAAAIVFLEGGRYLGFPLATLLASAGIGGLAIALAAQGMLKGLFGTVTLLLDKRFRVGDRIVMKDNDGIVEEIGLRSTKIREFLTNHLISIPNDQIADAEIENIGKRKHIRRLTNLQIPIDTAREKVEKAIHVIREILADHQGMDPAYPPRVYFNDFNPTSFNIQILYWYTPPELWSYLEFSEKINIQICKAFEEHEIPFSLPLRHTYWKHDYQQGPLEINLLESVAKHSPPSNTLTN